MQYYAVGSTGTSVLGEEISSLDQDNRASELEDLISFSNGNNNDVIEVELAHNGMIGTK